MDKPHYLMQFFTYDHLSRRAQEVAVEFVLLAEKVDRETPNNPEKTTALRKLLEAKDCAVRATFFKSENPKTANGNDSRKD